MNSGFEDNHASIEYYDSDYPSLYFSEYKENCDELLEFQGLANDVERYIEIAKETKSEKVLELCAGSGRISIPLAKEGLNVTAVDVSKGMLNQFEKNLKKEKEIKSRISLVHEDATKLNIAEKNHCMAIIGFNSLLCIPDFNEQMKTLENANKHLWGEGLLVIDIVNPAVMNINGDQNPKKFFTRKKPGSGNLYTRMAMASKMDENQKQELYGYYDEEIEPGVFKRTNYSIFWRPIHRFEIELMLEKAGFKIVRVEGGHKNEKYEINSPRMFITAQKVREL